MVNAGTLMIGLGHMILHNQIVPVIGAISLFIGLFSIIAHNDQTIARNDLARHSANIFTLVSSLNLSSFGLLHDLPVPLFRIC